MKVKILGSAGSYQSPTRQCSSYLVQADGMSILLDAGNGSFGNLLKVSDPFEVSAVFISHRHHDHMVDIISLYHYLKFVPDGTGLRGKIPLLASKVTHEFLSSFAAGSIFDIFERKVVEAGSSYDLGSVKIAFANVGHIDGALSIRLTDSSSNCLFYSGDSAYCRELVDSIPIGSTILTESTYLEHKVSGGRAIHMDALEVAQLCSKSQASSVIVTHVAHPNDPELVGELVRRNFAGAVEVAHDLDTFQIEANRLLRLTSHGEEGIQSDK